MKKLVLIALLFFVGQAFAQHVEPVRYEVDRWDKDQGCHFESFEAQGGLICFETEKMDKKKHTRMWTFTCLDSSLYELRSDNIPLPEKLALIGSGHDKHFVAFCFVNEKNRKASDSLDFLVVAFDRWERTYRTFWDKWPEKSVPLSVDVVDGTMLLSLNNKNGNGSLLFYDLTDNKHRIVTPSHAGSFVLFQTAAFPQEHCFVVATKDFAKKHFVATSFLVYSSSGDLVNSHRFNNLSKAALGRMGFRFDHNHNLVVIGTLEHESNRKVKLEGVTENFDKESLGVVWTRFASGEPLHKIYLFKNMPEIELALTSYDRLRVREERLKILKEQKKEQKKKKKKKKKAEKSEIAFQFLTPRLTDFGDLTVFSVEAFVPYYHTETRMSYGYSVGAPYSYTVFDGYDFFSEILLAFDHDGNLKWQRSVKFDNEFSFELRSHASEGACYDELVVVSPYRNRLRYTAFDADGKVLMNQQSVRVEAIHGADYVEEEYFAQITKWFGNRFLIYGSQIIQNSTRPKPRRTVFYLQKVQYD